MRKRKFGYRLWAVLLLASMAFVPVGAQAQEGMLAANGSLWQGHVSNYGSSQRSDDAVTVCDGETLAGLSNQWGASVSLNDRIKTQGKSSICLTTPDDATEDSVQGGFLLTFTRPADFSNYTCFEFDYYLQEATQGPQALMISLATTGVDGFNFLVTLEEAEVGWNHIILTLPGKKPVCKADLAQINTIRLAWLNYAKAPKRDFWFDHFYVCGVIDGSLPAPEITPGSPDDHTILFLDCDSLLGWRGVDGKGTVELRTDPQKTQGAASIRADFYDARQDSVYGGKVSVHFEKPVDLSNYSALQFDLFVGRAAADQTAVELVFSSDLEAQARFRQDIPAQYQGWKRVEILFDPVHSGFLGSVKQIDIAFVNHSQLDSQYFLFDSFLLAGCRDATVPPPEVLLQPSGPVDDTPKVNYGDVDDSGEIDACDALWVLQYSVGLQVLTGQRLEAADVNYDGLVDSTDALIILRYIVGLEQGLGGK